ncbi:hypothetical protein BDY21DRAFT_162639 [Lineolata rhizophorae]|uniref:Uncharacterized protein n=1 Tax=Lineolata rhizophorae TaxID=578093 RepID=A0A6A6P990_9PEZI|nr:hypothetical protein BDY21DRAFT_162639 [Lineolata rhizophorae]
MHVASHATLGSPFGHPADRATKIARFITKEIKKLFSFLFSSPRRWPEPHYSAANPIRCFCSHLLASGLAGPKHLNKNRVASAYLSRSQSQVWLVINLQWQLEPSFSPLAPWLRQLFIKRRLRRRPVVSSWRENWTGNTRAQQFPVLSHRSAHQDVTRRNEAISVIHTSAMKKSKETVLSLCKRAIYMKDPAHSA